MPEETQYLNKTLGVSHEGWPFVFLAFGLGFLLACLSLWTLIFTIPIVLWVPWFFRDPDRDADPFAREHKSAILSPADGKVVSIEKVESPKASGEWVHRIGIFMNVFDVHVNRAPLDGQIIDMNYQNGGYVNAAHEKASLDNEQNQIQLKTSAGESIWMHQIAGLVARRIVCRAAVGDQLEKGQRFGLIRFGSRVDLYLPLSYDMKTSVGSRVLAGHTTLAWKGA